MKDFASGSTILFLLTLLIAFHVSAFPNGPLWGEITMISIDLIIALGLVLGFYFSSKQEKEDKAKEEELENAIANWSDKSFSKYLGKEILKLRYDSILLLRSLQNEVPPYFSDYSFIVSPMAKAYEGFLKKILVDTGAIDKQELKNHPGLSVNKYFHPVEGKMMKYISDIARERAIPAVIYTVYQECRNEIMHFDLYQHPSKKNIRNIEEAEFFIKRIEDAIEKAYYTFIEPLEKKQTKYKNKK